LHDHIFLLNSEILGHFKRNACEDLFTKCSQYRFKLITVQEPNSMLHIVYVKYRSITQMLHKLRYRPKKDNFYTLIMIRRIPFKAMMLMVMMTMMTTTINGLWRKRGSLRNLVFNQGVPSRDISIGPVIVGPGSSPELFDFPLLIIISPLFHVHH
jgi:hypothetical protein